MSHGDGARLVHELRPKTLIITLTVPLPLALILTLTPTLTPSLTRCTSCAEIWTARRPSYTRGTGRRLSPTTGSE